MIAKTFKGGRTARGARATLLYLLNQRVAEGTAKLLRGDQEITQALISQAEKKQKWSWSSGVLSFEELIEDGQTIEEIMDDFERTFFAGLDKDQYDILWVMHTDKGRTELHYVAPRMELSTGLSYNPYFVKRDFAKKDLFQEHINLKYGLSSYKDSREVTPRPPRWRETAKKKDIRQAFDEALLPLVTEGIITSREELIYQLEEWGFELNRAGKEYISVTDKNGKNHRLKGHIYAESFTSWAGVEEQIERERATVANGVSRELTAVRAELDRIIEQQAHTNRERYKREDRGDQEVRRDKDTELSKRKPQTLQRDDQGREAGVDRGAEKVEKVPAHSSPHRPYIWLDSGSIGYSAILSLSTELERQRERGSEVVRRNTVSTDQQDTKSNNHQGQLNDSTGTEAIGRIRSLRESTERRARSVHEIPKGLSGAVEGGAIIFDERDADRLFGIAGKADRAIRDYCQSAEPNYRAIEQTANGRQSARAVTIFGGAISKGISSIKSIFDRRDQGIVRAVGARIKDKAMQELNRFKTNINLAEFATAFGYYKDKEKSSINAPVMRHENGDKIIIGKDRSDGHYIYFNPNDEGDSGTVIDFVKNRTGETLGYIRKRLRSWLHNPQPQENIPVKASTKDALRIANIWSAIEETTSPFDSHWGVHHVTLDRLQRMRNVKRGKDHEYYFALSDLNGICGIERRTREDKHIISGSTKGVFVDGEIKEAKEIVIFESPVDMISYMELHNQIYDTDRYYVCTMGSIGESAEKSLEAIFDYNKDANIIVAVDNDQGGDTITEKIATILSRVDGNISRASRHKPTTKDWNDDLKAEKQEREQTQTQRRSRGIHR